MKSLQLLSFFFFPFKIYKFHLAFDNAVKQFIFRINVPFLSCKVDKPFALGNGLFKYIKIDSQDFYRSQVSLYPPLTLEIVLIRVIFPTVSSSIHGFHPPCSLICRLLCYACVTWRFTALPLGRRGTWLQQHIRFGALICRACSASPREASGAPPAEARN